MAEDDIPDGWVRVKLDELGMARTQSIDPSKYPDKEFELWSVPSFPSGEPEMQIGADIGSTKQQVAAGDVLLCKINPRINRVWVVDARRQFEQIASSEWIVFRNGEVDPFFLMHRFREGVFRERLCADVSGVGGSLTRARPQTVKNLEVTLPPLAEQRRIVGKIEALQERSRNAREALTEVGPLLEQFRQSLLAAAFRGDLTADWRAANLNVEPATELLIRIRQERREKWEQAELAKYEAKGKQPPKNWKVKYQAEMALELTDDLPDLPENWCYARADEIVAPDTVITYGIVQPGPHIADGVPYIRGQDIDDGRILSDQLLRTSPELHAKHSRSCVNEGDVLLCVIRHLKVALVPEGINDVNLTQGTVRLRPSEVINGQYLARYLASPSGQRWMLRKHFGLAMPRINVADARAVPIPLAPLEEQEEIIA
ncbi:MAG: restriction endonuclease subunit S, partial [Planctomycetota bacterium]